MVVDSTLYLLNRGHFMVHLLEVSTIYYILCTLAILAILDKVLATSYIIYII